MLGKSTVLAKDVLGPGSPLSRILPGYEDRPAQLAMAEAVEQALADDRPLFVEAGTGTGKTLAYLVPAILSGKKVVVSTATRALEEQIMASDLPLVQKALAPFGIQVRAALMKGLSNYLCKRRFEELRTTQGARLATDRLLSRIEAWAKETETGDRAELVDLPENADAWREVQSSTETRIGARCPHYEECFVTRMREDAEQAQIVVVNHHLFFADLALRRGPRGEYASAIPNYDAVILDEAHRLEDIATDFFGVRVSQARVDALVRDARRSLLALGQLSQGGARPILDLVEEASARFFESLRRGAAERRVLSGDDWTSAALKAHGKLDACLEALAGHAQSGRDEAVLAVARRAWGLREDLRAIVDGSRSAASESDDDDSALDFDPDELASPRSSDVSRRGGAVRNVAWIDFKGSRGSVALGASPIELGSTLREALFDRVPGVVLTSATLATAAAGQEPSFHFAKARVGAPPEARGLVVPSPFDFERRAALYVTRQMPDPADPSWDEALASRAADLVGITGGGAFILCTSTRSMNAVHARLRTRLDLPLFVQGQAPKHLLLSKFRGAGDAVLVATMSFWEGVDVPGRALRLVVIDKIPFAVPTDPVTRARCEQIARHGGNAFSQYSVPCAAITLKQGFGRLIRTQTDAGIVAILDPRIMTRSYGRMLLGSLPPAKVLRDLDQLRDFWAGVAV
jgi:ATP-dependent DNA helicase DinG